MPAAAVLLTVVHDPGVLLNTVHHAAVLTPADAACADAAAGQLPGCCLAQLWCTSGLAEVLTWEARVSAACLGPVHNADSHSGKTDCGHAVAVEVLCLHWCAAAGLAAVAVEGFVASEVAVAL